MSIGKKRAVRVVVSIEAVTNLDNFTLEQRFETFIDPNRFREERLDPKEYIRFMHTRIDHQPLGGAPQVTMQMPAPTLPLSPETKLQLIKELTESVQGKYGHPDELETAVFSAFEQIARIVG